MFLSSYIIRIPGEVCIGTRQVCIDNATSTKQRESDRIPQGFNELRA